MWTSVPQTRSKCDERGFAILGLSIAVVIAGAAVAAALPGYQSVTATFKTYAVRSELTSAIQDETVYFLTESTYGTAAQLREIDPGVPWATDPLTAVSGKAITVDANPEGAPANTVILGGKAQDGPYYWAELTNGKVTYATKATPAEPSYRSLLGLTWTSSTTLR